jgi:hypothetical protein
MPTLSLRAVNRATLDRQLLLRRHPLPARQAVRHLAGLQAQAPLAPYVGLWTRRSVFNPAEISTHLSERTVVRAPIMRGTVHLVDAADFVAFRPLFSALMAGALRANFTRRLTGVDLTALVAEASALLADRPHTRAQLAKALAVRWPDADPMALAYAATYLVPVVQVPPRGIWGKSAQATWLTADAWLAPLARDSFPADQPVGGRSQDDAPLPDGSAVERLVMRYLAAFGPASVADAQTWSGLSRLREVTERLGLRTYRGPDGAELLDLPDIPLPDEDIPAPPRFLPEYDNLLLSHADRRRVIPHDLPVPLAPGNGGTQGSLLIDGLWDATWKITKGALTISSFRSLTNDEKADITQEGARLLAFTAPDSTAPDSTAPGAAADPPDIRFTAAHWNPRRCPAWLCPISTTRPRCAPPAMQVAASLQNASADARGGCPAGLPCTDNHDKTVTHRPGIVIADHNPSPSTDYDPLSRETRVGRARQRGRATLAGGAEHRTVPDDPYLDF